MGSEEEEAPEPWKPQIRDVGSRERGLRLQGAEAWQLELPDGGNLS